MMRTHNCLSSSLCVSSYVIPVPMLRAALYRTCRMAQYSKAADVVGAVVLACLLF